MKTVSDTSSAKSSLQPKTQREGILRGIKRGENAIKEGHVLTHEQAKEKLKKWL
jgi:predicted transcriptional regulator